jgi:hypothetical protein
MTVRRSWFFATAAVVSAVVLAANVISVTPARADEPQKPAAQVHAGGEENPLHDAMEAMGKAFKALKAQVSDPTKNESSLQLVVELERHTLAAKSMTPRGATTRPTNERAKYLADYRVDMANLLRVELELEEALLENKNEKAAEAFKTLSDMMGEGHREFRPKRKRD